MKIIKRSLPRYTSGDSLLGLADKLLGDPNRWREIADLNGIEPPYTIYPG